MKTQENICAECSAPFVADGITTGYGTAADGKRYCFACCGKRDVEQMTNDGRIVLYLDTAAGTVSNWPGTLKIKIFGKRTGRHNIAGKRYDVWFIGPDKAQWHGVTFGDMTQICHCKRIKHRYAWMAAA